MIQYDSRPVVNGLLNDSWKPPHLLTTEFEGTADIGTVATASGEFTKSLGLNHTRSVSDMIGAGGGFPRSASTNTLSTVASGNQLSGAGSSTNLRALGAVGSQGVQRSQFDESEDPSMAAIHRTLSQLALGQQAEMPRSSALGAAQQDSYDSLGDMDNRSPGDLTQGVDGLARLESVMGGGPGQAPYASFPGTRSLPGPSRPDEFPPEFSRDSIQNMRRSDSHQSLAHAPPLPLEVCSRIILVSNVDPSTKPEHLQEVFQEHGDLRSLYTGLIHNGVVMISYYDLRASALAVNFLNGRPVNGRPLSVAFHEPKEGTKDAVEGVVSLFNVDEGIPLEDVLAIVTTFGDVKSSDVKSIAKHPTVRKCRLVEFYDVRHAELAFQKINANPRVPTISEDPQAPQHNGTGAQLLQDWHPPSWDMHNPTGSDPLLNMMTGNGGLSGAFDGSQSNLRMLPQSSSNTSMTALHDAHLQADMIRAQLLQSHASGSNLHAYLRPTGGLGMGTSASHPNLTSILQPPSSPTQPTTTNGLQHGGLSMSTNELALLSLNQSLAEHTPLRRGGVVSMSTGNIAELYAQQAKGLRGTGSSNSLFGTGIADNIFLGQRYGGVLGQLPGLNLDSIGAQGAPGSFQPSPRHLHDPSALAQQYLQLLQSSPGALVGNVGYPGISPTLTPTRDPRMRLRRDDDRSLSNRMGRSRNTDPAAEAERKAAQERMYALDPEKVTAGEDSRSTLMIKNIPNKYTQKMLLTTIDAEFKGQYDFFYLPIDFKNKCNVGYAFINMIDTKYIVPIYERFNNKKWERFNSEKICHITYARIQGKANLVTHFQNSSLLNEDKRCRPVLFHVTGEPEPFPTGPNPREGGLRASRSTGCVNSTSLHR